VYEGSRILPHAPHISDSLTKLVVEPNSVCGVVVN